MLILPCLADAQVSPGPLSKVHHALDNPLKCASCHVFGSGKPKLKCQNCHEEVRALVRNHEGMHGHVVNAAKGDVDCARCHTEHYGENFRIFKWETSKEEFDHRQTGYILEGRHASLRCEQCHNPKNIAPADRQQIRLHDLSATFEGLHPACLTCHQDQHAGQLGADCQKCHGMSAWKPVKTFDHSTTHFPLVGKHQNLECAKCHRPSTADAKVVQYTGLSFASCTGCHQDPHRGAFPARCEQCHGNESWKQVRNVSSFNHSGTHFPLEGKHRDVACLKCHQDANFKTPLAHDKCLDCHRDPHKAQFVHRADGGDCRSCHTVDDWRATTFTEAAHRTTGFALTGKHSGLACAKCHSGAGVDTDYHPHFQACTDCHRDPHSGQFAASPRNNMCEACHTVSTFEPATFSIRDHQSSSFALKGAHLAVSCQECHMPAAGSPWNFHFANQACSGCHKDPHHGDFPAALTANRATGSDLCESCHVVARWQQVKPFDHSLTAFGLTGAHQALACSACHRPIAAEAERQLPFRVASTRCEGCHEDIHQGQFRASDNTVDCTRCHTTSRWTATLFDHETGSTFSLRGAHKDVPCRMCHDVKENPTQRKIAIYKGTPRECNACHH